MCRKRLNLRKKRFGMLVVIKFAGMVGGRTAWLCKCDCGRVKTVRGSQLMAGHVNSCGCYLKHGMSKTSIYAIWTGMKQRCMNPKAPDYKYYGKRGIKVCNRWLDFLCFYMDMGDRPFNGAQIDRRNNDGHYEPNNCRWVTRKVNCNNRRNKSL